MRIPGRTRLKRAVRAVKTAHQPVAAVLLYHRVFIPSNDPQLLCVHPDRFRQHLDLLRSTYNVVSLQELVGMLGGEKIPKKTVAITFDDGYADNLLHAKPILEETNTPATVFVTSGVIGSRREFWWDELDRLLLQPGRLPRELRVTIEGAAHAWDLDGSADYTEKQFLSHSGWSVLDAKNPTMRHAVYRTLHELLRPLQPASRDPVIDDIRQWAGLPVAGRDSHRPLSRAEVVDLSTGDLVEVAAHTRIHPRLVSLPIAVQREEVQASKLALEELLGKPVLSFAYPYGTSVDYNPDTVRLVREVGFTCACSNFRGTVERTTDPYQLPRCVVRNWDVNEFGRQIETLFRE